MEKVALLLQKKKPYLKIPVCFLLFQIGSKALNLIGKFYNTNDNFSASRAFCLKMQLKALLEYKVDIV